MTIVKLSNIKIKKSFEKSTPRKEKLQKCREYWQQNKLPDRDIILNSRGYLIDGYIQYLVLKENNIQTATVTISKTNQDVIYVYGVHCDAHCQASLKEYVWRLPTSWISKGVHNQIVKGDELFVWTRRGLSKIKVTKIEKLSKPPVHFKIRKVAWKV